MNVQTVWIFGCQQCKFGGNEESAGAAEKKAKEHLEEYTDEEGLYNHSHEVHISQIIVVRS